MVISMVSGCILLLRSGFKSPGDTLAISYFKLTVLYYYFTLKHSINHTMISLVGPITVFVSVSLSLGEIP